MHVKVERPLVPINVFAALAGLLSTILITFQVTTNWQWSILMDDIAHLRDYSPLAAPSVWQRLVDDVAGYARSGRMLPIKYVMNLVEYRYLAANPLFPHILHTVVLFGTL